MSKRFKTLNDKKFTYGAHWMGIGFEFIIVVGGLCFLGFWLDRAEGTSPGWMIIGFFVGFAVMLRIMIKRAKADENRSDFDSDKTDSQPGSDTTDKP